MNRWLAALAIACAMPAMAIDRIQLRAASIRVADRQLNGVDARLFIASASRSRVELRAAAVQLPQATTAQTGALRQLRVACANPVVREPLFECQALHFDIQSSRWPALALTGTAHYRSDTGSYAVRSTSLQIADRPLTLALQGDPDGLQLDLGLRDLQLSQLPALLRARQIPVPDLKYSGQADVAAKLVQRGGRTRADLQLDLHAAAFENTDFTVAGEKLDGRVTATVDLGASPLPFKAELTGNKGQALAGPVLLDLQRNPLQLTVAGRLAAESLVIDTLQMAQRDLATTTGTAVLALSPLRLREATLEVQDIRFPAAYTSFLQLALSTTPFNQLNTTGRATLRARLQDNALTQLDATLQDVSLGDPGRALKVEKAAGELHWATGLVGPPRPSWLSWEASEGWGIVGARSRVDFIAAERDFRLTRPARLPFFDGALRINTLAVSGIGTDALQGLFDAEVEPISLAPIARAMGLPEFAGQLSGRIPGLTYRNKLLSLDGRLEADVFGGRLTASNLRLRDPLGPWPRLYGDVVARNLDLGLITSTFEFGNITGRLDMDLTELETFNWSPVAFNLRLATPPGDRSRRRINQRAIKLLSDIGGGGGGVAAALQSGALRFFDDFGYDRMGLSCVLRNDVCQMSGIEPAGTGFYIVKGSSLPRIDIIGNNSRVAWPQLVAQVVNAVKNPEGIELK